MTPYKFKTYATQADAIAAGIAFPTFDPKKAPKLWFDPNAKGWTTYKVFARAGNTVVFDTAASTPIFNFITLSESDARTLNIPPNNPVDPDHPNVPTLPSVTIIPPVEVPVRELNAGEVWRFNVFGEPTIAQAPVQVNVTPSLENINSKLDKIMAFFKIA